MILCKAAIDLLFARAPDQLGNVGKSPTLRLLVYVARL
jgi:hypothetical protein